MAPGRKRGAKGLKTKSELSLGDLVLAKVKGFPAWPAKIGRPEDWERVPDPKKYFVQFFGTSEIAFVAPADIQSFTNEAKNKLSARCLGKTVKYFAQAVKEICDEFEELQQKKVSGVGDDNGTQTHPSVMQSVDPAVDDALDVSQTNGILPECKLETKESVDVGSDLEHCPHKQDEVECNDVKPYLSDDVNRSLSPPVSSRKRKNLSANDSNLLKDSLTVSSPSQHSCKKEDPLDIKVKGSQNELTNGDRPKLAMESKKKSQAAVLSSGGSAIPRDRSAEILRRKLAGGIMKLSSDSKLQLDVTGEKREKRLVKEKRHSEAPDDGQKDAKVKSESHNDAISQKKLKVQHGREKQGSQINEASFSAKISKTADTAKYPNLTKAQVNSKSDSRSPNVLDAKMANKELKRHTPVEKALPTKLPVVNNTDANHLSDEDDHPPIKRHRRESEAMSGSENRLGTSASQKTDSVLPSKHRSPVVQLSMKRRSVRLCDDDDDDELPKTPIHGGATSKVSVTQRASDSKKKSVTRGEGCANDLKASRNSGKVDNGIKEQEHSGGGMNKVLPPAAKQGMEKRTREYPAALLSPSSRQLESEKLAPMNSEKIGPRKVVPVSVSPKRSSQHIGGARLSGELESKQPNKVPGSDFQRKSPVGDIKKSASSDRLNLDPTQSLCERSSQPSSGEKKKTTAKSDSRINDTAVGSSNENIKPVHERPSAGKDKNATHVVDSKTSDSVTSIKHLIAAAQARKKQTHLQNTYGNPFLFSFPDVDMVGRGRSPPPAALAYEASKTLQQDVLGPHHTSPCSNVQQTPSNNQHENDELEERRVSSGHQGTGSSLSGGTEAAVARDAFEGMIETLSRTKESIARATRLAIDCAKFGLASEVVELLIQKLENEPSLHRRVDLFFLVDSITQCSHSQRGASYVYTIQAALPRLIGAAAPAGAGAQENRRQCRKVLRLWLERKILPESVLRRHMDDLGVVNDDTAISHRRPSRAERAIDDPIREMEGMVVDEYGSNAMFQLPGLVLVNVFEEEEDDEDAADTNLCMRDDDKSPCKHTPVTSRDPENCSVTPSDRRHCILEEVDGELEMEDVSGHHKDERPSVNDGSVDLALLELNPDGLLKSPSNISTEYLPSPEGSPPLPPGSPPPTPPLPTSPPPSSPPPPPPPLSSPPQPPPPPPPPPTTQQHPFPQPPVPPQPPIGPPPHVGPTPPVGPLPPHLRPQPHMGPLHPPFGPPPHLSHPVQLTTQQSFPSQPPLVSQNKTPPALPHPLPHEVGTTQTANQQSVTGSTAHGSHNDASGRGEVLPQQKSHFPPSGASIAREHGGYNSSRHGEDDAYMNPQASQLRQQYLPASVPFPPRPVHTELPAQRLPSHFPYPNSAHQHQYNSYSIPNFSDGQRRYVADEQWRKQGNDFNANHPRGGWTPGGRPYSHEGYHERPPASAINFQHSAPSNLPSSGQIPVHGVPMMGSRPNMSTVNWRPA